MKKVISALMLTCTLLYADVTVNDFVDHSGFVDFSVIGEEPISLVMEAVSGNTVTLKFESEEGKDYTITYSPDLSLGSWQIDGTTALFNGIEVTAEGLDRYFYTATSSTTTVEITFTEGAPKSAFFKGAEFVSF
jgi:hypothetical protein